MAVDPMQVWANMKRKRWPERYWLCGLDDEHAELTAIERRSSDPWLVPKTIDRLTPVSGLTFLSN